MIKISENICVVPHCEKTKFLVEKGCPFCIEHSTKFKDFAPRYEVPSEIKKILRTDEELPDEFFIHMISTFCDEDIEEWHKINTPPIKNKQKTKTKKREKNESR